MQFKINKEVKDINGWGFTTKTGHLRHRLPDAGADHGDRARRQPPAGCGLPDLGEGRTTVGPMTAPGSTSCAFDKGELPPVSGFLVADHVRRRTTSSSTTRSTAIRSARGRTSTTTLTARSISSSRMTSPGADKEYNWLPAPAGKFVLMLRLYWPNENDPSIIDGTWIIPAVKEAG